MRIYVKYRFETTLASASACLLYSFILIAIWESKLEESKT